MAYSLANLQTDIRNYTEVSGTSTGGVFLQKNVLDTTLTILEYEGNIKGHIFVSWLHPFKEHRLMVIGSQGMISFEDSAKNKPLKLYSKSYDILEGFPAKKDGSIELIPYGEEIPLTAELIYFINQITLCLIFYLLIR